MPDTGKIAWTLRDGDEMRLSGEARLSDALDTIYYPSTNNQRDTAGDRGCGTSPPSSLRPIDPGFWLFARLVLGPGRLVPKYTLWKNRITAAVSHSRGKQAPCRPLLDVFGRWLRSHEQYSSWSLLASGCDSLYLVFHLFFWCLMALVGQTRRPPLYLINT